MTTSLKTYFSSRNQRAVTCLFNDLISYQDKDSWTRQISLVTNKRTGATSHGNGEAPMCFSCTTIKSCPPRPRIKEHNSF